MKEQSRTKKQLMDELSALRKRNAVLEKAAVLRENGKAGEAARVLDAYTASCLERVLETLDELEDRFDGKVQSVSQELRLEKLVGELEAKRKEHHIPGMAIAVVKDGDVVLAQGFGSADLENKKPVTPETLFAIGSTTKAFTATLISMLVDDSSQRLQAEIGRVAPRVDHVKLALQRGKIKCISIVQRSQGGVLIGLGIPVHADIRNDG